MTATFRTSQGGSAADTSVPHLILVGLPGSGKSTVGALVGQQLGRTFLDLDREIERREGRSVAAIFGEEGEHYFRARERRLTEELREFGGMILAPGGGWVADPAVVALLRPPATLVYLRISPERALARLGALRNERPLLRRPNPLDELKRLLQQREAAYLTADHVIDVEALDPQRVADAVAPFVAPVTS